MVKPSETQPIIHQYDDDDGKSNNNSFLNEKKQEKNAEFLHIFFSIQKHGFCIIITIIIIMNKSAIHSSINVL